MSHMVRSILLAGRPRDVWPVAAILAPVLPSSIALHVIEDPAPGPPSALTVPLDSTYHARLGLDLKTLVSQCGGVPSLGSRLLGFTNAEEGFVSAPSGTLPMIGGVALHQFLIRASREGEDGTDLMEALAPFRFAARAAAGGKFALPSDGPESPLAMLGPQASIDSDRYAAMLRGKCASACMVTPGVIEEVSLGEGGAVRSVRLRDGASVEADLFIDCSGDLSALVDARGELTHAALSRLEKISAAFNAKADVPSLPTYKADAFGIAALTPVNGGSVVSYRHTSDAPAEHVSQIVGEQAVSADALAPFSNAPWSGNCVRMACAAGSLSPMLGADAVLMQEMALHLADCLPARTDMAHEARAFNRRFAETAAAIADFANAPVFLGTRTEPLWASSPSAANSQTLQIRRDQFASRGRIPSIEREYADEQTWIEMFTALGVRPRQYDRRAGAISSQQAKHVLDTIRQQLDAALAAMPLREAYLQTLA